MTIQELRADPSLYRGEPGVYMFKLRDVVLYVGQSSDLRKRVLSHFAPSSTNNHYRGYARAQSQHLHEVLHICDEEIDIIFSTVGIDQLNQVEEAMIRHYKPLYNYDGSASKRYKPVKRKDKGFDWND